MERRVRAILTGIIGFAGALFLLGLTVYPFQYGLTESLLLVGALVILALFETVLDDTSF
jgi:hypothetical protein